MGHWVRSTLITSHCTEYESVLLRTPSNAATALDPASHRDPDLPAAGAEHGNARARKTKAVTPSAIQSTDAC